MQLIFYVHILKFVDQSNSSKGLLIVFGSRSVSTVSLRLSRRPTSASRFPSFCCSHSLSLYLLCSLLPASRKASINYRDCSCWCWHRTPFRSLFYFSSLAVFFVFRNQTSRQRRLTHDSWPLWLVSSHSLSFCLPVTWISSAIVEKAIPDGRRKVPQLAFVDAAVIGWNRNFSRLSLSSHARETKSGRTSKVMRQKETDMTHARNERC